jgi:hypothetical protein
LGLDRLFSLEFREFYKRSESLEGITNDGIAIMCVQAYAQICFALEVKLLETTSEIEKTLSKNRPNTHVSGVLICLFPNLIVELLERRETPEELW